MIVTVTANAAVDVTYHVDGLQWDAAHRVRSVHRQAGGKGINVSRALICMEQPTAALAVVGGRVGQCIADDLLASGIDHRLVSVDGTSRHTTTVASGDGHHIAFDEPGVSLSTDDWSRVVDEFRVLARTASVVTICGSAPPGSPHDAYAELIGEAHRVGVPVILDTSGPALRTSLPSRPDVIKPNSAELADAVGYLPESGQLIGAARLLLSRGAGAVVATFGIGGALVLDEHATYRIVNTPKTGNPVGAGDALVAGMAAAMSRGESLPHSARAGVVWAHASLSMPYAGWLRPADVAASEGEVAIASAETACV